MPSQDIIPPVACRAARAILNWSHSELVRRAQVSPHTIVKIEAGRDVRCDTAAKVAATFEAAGVEVLTGARAGARLKG